MVAVGTRFSLIYICLHRASALIKCMEEKSDLGQGETFLFPGALDRRAFACCKWAVVQ